MLLQKVTGFLLQISWPLKNLLTGQVLKRVLSMVYANIKCLRHFRRFTYRHLRWIAQIFSNFFRFPYFLGKLTPFCSMVSLMKVLVPFRKLSGRGLQLPLTRFVLVTGFVALQTKVFRVLWTVLIFSVVMNPVINVH